MTSIDCAYESLSTYLNYLSGGMLGCVGNSCTVEDWQMDEKLVRLAEKLSEYYQERMEELEYIDEYKEIVYGCPVSIRDYGRISSTIHLQKWAGMRLSK